MVETTIRSFDRCLLCQYLGNGCSGPRTSAMTYERWLDWVRALKRLRRVSNAQISEDTGLSKNTVDNIFAGKQKDVSRTTAGLIDDYLIGGDARWPCSMDLNVEKDVVYQDRPETLIALEEKSIELEFAHKSMEDIHISYKQQMDAVRAQFQRTIDYLLKESERKDATIEHLLKENARKNELVDKLLK